MDAIDNLLSLLLVVHLQNTCEGGRQVVNCKRYHNRKNNPANNAAMINRIMDTRRNTKIHKRTFINHPMVKPKKNLASPYPMSPKMQEIAIIKAAKIMQNTSLQMRV